MNDYKEAVHLFDTVVHPPILPDGEKLNAINELCKYFAEELQNQPTIPEDANEKRKLLRALLNIRPPLSISAHIQNLLDRVLWSERVDAGIVEPQEITPVLLGDNFSLHLWHGDICRLDCDAIVNAANNKLLGCFHPLHSCIDNAIHTGAGPRLREDCHTIMTLQDDDEETGSAKITRAYNLPSRFVLHTVGPIVQTVLQEKHKQLLASCYRSCLALAAETKQVKSIAFCCISTGVFGFPAKPAAEIAIEIARQWAQENPGVFERIIFNVFTENDFELYRYAFNIAG
jgi:O-acetyl-ADP-ribose deacetylase (regulator of RNase III)